MPVLPPDVVGSTSDVDGGTTPNTLTLAAANAVPGDVVLIASVTSTTVGPPVYGCTNATFVTVVGPIVMGTRTFQVIARLVEQNDPASYLCNLGAASATHNGAMVAVRNTDIRRQSELATKLVVGTVGRRQDAVGTATTNVAPALASLPQDALVLVASGEATTTDDTVAPSITAGGATTVMWTDDPSTESVLWAKKSQLAAGATTPVTVTYQNSQAANGAAVQIGVLALSPWRQGRHKVWNGTEWVPRPTRAWSGSAWTERPVRVYG